jgi:hypothetical protein
MSIQLTYGSQPINGQLVPEYTSTAMFPSPAYVPYYAGKGAATPTLPPPVQFHGNGSDPWTSGLDMSGAVSQAAADPFNPVKSPVIWAIVFLVVGILGLRHVHWRG